MSARLPTPESFHKDVANHRMEILHEDGLYRHLRFSNKGSSVYRFDIVTYPGFLCYSGDMGCYVFSRLPDMLEFFRFEQSPEPQSSIPLTLRINPGYWGEKCVSREGKRELRKYDYDTLVALVNEWIEQEIRDSELPDHAAAALREAVKDEILNADSAHDGSYAAMSLLRDFQFNYDEQGLAYEFRFENFYEMDPTEWDYHFIWCCYALSYAVQTYDIEKRRLAAQTPTHCPKFDSCQAKGTTHPCGDFGCSGPTLASNDMSTYQERVANWMELCFGDSDPNRHHTRVRRFLEEANELAQSLGVSKEDAIELVNYTWSRPPGQPKQEVGGVKVTLAAVCAVHGLGDEAALGETELTRVSTPEMIRKIRAKQASKPAGGNLPEPWPRTNPWAAAIDEARVVGHLSPTTPDMDPERALADLIAFEVQVALDPAVSSEAAALIEKGREVERHYSEWQATWERPTGEQLQTILSMVGYDAPEAVTATWPDEKVRQAEYWACALHLHASDNDVWVPPRPDWMPQPWNGPMQGDPDSIMSSNPTILTADPVNASGVPGTHEPQQEKQR